MDIWVNPKIEENLRKEGWRIPIKPNNGPIYFKDVEVGFSDNFIGLRVKKKSKSKKVHKTLTQNEHF